MLIISKIKDNKLFQYIINFINIFFIKKMYNIIL